jgi:predicted neuraminidase
VILNRLIFRRMLAQATKLWKPERSDEIGHTAVLSDEFIFDESPNAMSHASTIVEARDGLVAAWFAGTMESRPDVSIWASRNSGSGWSTPIKVADGVMPDGKRYACWNPVLFQAPGGALLLFYKVGPSPKRWWGMCMKLGGDGTWGAPMRLPDGILGPIKNKPVQLANGDLLSPSSDESDGWRVHLERSSDMGKTWTRTDPLNDGRTVGAIQSSILHYADDRLQMLCRTKQGRIAETWSDDGGNTWSEVCLTSLRNPNSGTDALSLSDGRQLLVYNPSTHWRSPLEIASSVDGKTWQDVLTLADGAGEFSYPAIIQTADGLVHVTYTWNLSRIRHVVIDPTRLAPATPIG